MMSSFGLKLGMGFGLVVLGTTSLSQTAAGQLSKDTLFTMDLATMLAAISGIAAFVYWAAKDRASVDARLDRMEDAINTQMDATKQLERSMDQKLSGIRDDMHELTGKRK